MVNYLVTWISNVCTKMSASAKSNYVLKTVDLFLICFMDPIIGSHWRNYIRFKEENQFF